MKTLRTWKANGRLAAKTYTEGRPSCNEPSHQAAPEIANEKPLAEQEPVFEHVAERSQCGIGLGAQPRDR